MTLLKDVQNKRRSTIVQLLIEIRFGIFDIFRHTLDLLKIKMKNHNNKQILTHNTTSKFQNSKYRMTIRLI